MDGYRIFDGLYDLSDLVLGALSENVQVLCRLRLRRSNLDDKTVKNIIDSWSRKKLDTLNISGLNRVNVAERSYYIRTHVKSSLILVWKLPFSYEPFSHNSEFLSNTVERSQLMCIFIKLVCSILNCGRLPPEYDREKRCVFWLTLHGYIYTLVYLWTNALFRPPPEQ
ncbi:hypothetical protein BDB00DRAFT_140071 [Zychaea mexicana]|uniref:uncharacterized protein n=1 Tax=Zychaea mexicana TaxID=64656 RepID=UPI0022FDC7EE|nr:uncharacterized protein BDB00DRAFT_140071 [Zychaea mexicana]KAI9496271.1 hypothetical protein BDB00DRAFT_140071 [Zychaea mexicana]